MEFLFKLFSDHGLDSWLVGGAVRDSLRGIDPSDLDFVVGSDIETIARITGGKIVGPKPNRVCVFRHGVSVVEVTRLRGNVIEEDLALRDFTVNAMAVNSDGDIIDPFGGQTDLRDGVLRFVGDGLQRLKEDPIRALRFCRFASSLNYSPDEISWKELRSFIQMEDDNVFSGISDHRIGKEMLSGLCFPSSFVRTLFNSGLLARLVPGFKREVFPETMRFISLIEEAVPKPDLILHIASVFIGFLPDISPVNILKDWGVPRGIREKVELLVTYHVEFNSCCEYSTMGWCIRKLGPDLIKKLLVISRLKEMCSSDDLSRWKVNNATYDEVALRFKKAESEGFLLSGRALLKCGISEGPAIGDLLDTFYNLLSQGDILSMEDLSRWLQSSDIKIH